MVLVVVVVLLLLHAKRRKQPVTHLVLLLTSRITCQCYPSQGVGVAGWVGRICFGEV